MFGILDLWPHFQSQPVCYLSLENVFNKFHAVLLVAQFAGAKLVQVNGADYPANKNSLTYSTVHPRQINYNARLSM